MTRAEMDGAKQLTPERPSDGYRMWELNDADTLRLNGWTLQQVQDNKTKINGIVTSIQQEGERLAGIDTQARHRLTSARQEAAGISFDTP